MIPLHWHDRLTKYLKDKPIAQVLRIAWHPALRTLFVYYCCCSWQIRIILWPTIFIDWNTFYSRPESSKHLQCQSKHSHSDHEIFDWATGEREWGSARWKERYRVKAISLSLRHCLFRLGLVHSVEEEDRFLSRSLYLGNACFHVPVTVTVTVCHSAILSDTKKNSQIAQYNWQITHPNNVGNIALWVNMM